MLHYILQTVAFQLFFLIIYDVFLKTETFFNWNRFYLLITAFASVVLPFIKFESMRTIVPEQFVIRLPEVIIGDVENVSNNAATTIEMTSQTIVDSSFIWSWNYVLYAGMVLASLLLLYKIIRLSILIQKNPKRWKGNLIIINLLKSNAAFSFFNYIFLGEWIKEEEKETILKHELVHVHQKHSLDLLLFEIFRILFWFNPLIYMYQNRITIVHEYIADAKAMKRSDKKQYYEKLLSQVFDSENISFTNTFFIQSLIKKRIVMLSKSKSHRSHLLKYALLIPLVFGMLVYTSSYGQVEYVKEAIVNQELTFEQLKEKYYNEIIELYKEGGNSKRIQSHYDIRNKPIVKDKYINNKDDVAKMYAFDKWAGDEALRWRKEQGIYQEKDLEFLKNVYNRYKSYEDYLIYQKTDEAKLDWESDIQDGVLRLVVDDMRNFTEAEKKKMQDKINLIEKDDYFHSLLMTDGKMSSTMLIHSVDGKDIPGPSISEVIGNAEPEDIEVPFSVIDEVPTTEECKSFATNDEKRQCLSDYISRLVGRNFNTKLAEELNLKGRQRIVVLFKIGKDGNINEVLARAPHPKLEEEAKRVIKLLPQMIPGKHKGKAVVVPYSLPIVFQVKEDATSDKSDEEKFLEIAKLNSVDIPFSVVEVAPISKECQKHDSETVRRSCTTDIISSFVNENFNTKIAKDKGMTGTQRIVGFFRIDENGFIIDVKARAKNEELQLEALRVLSSLPQMIPGKHDGKPVVVSYSLPIVFQVNE